MDISKSFDRSAFTIMAALSISLIAGNAQALARSHKHTTKGQDEVLIAGFPFSKSKSAAKDDSDADSSNTTADKEAKKAEKKKAKDLKKAKDEEGSAQEAAKAKTAPAQTTPAKAASTAKTTAATAKAAVSGKGAAVKASTADSADKATPAKHAPGAAASNPPDSTTAAAGAASAEVVATEPEVTPVFVPDSALISLLKDLSRSLADQEQLDKIEDANQKSVIEMAKRVLAKALENPELKSNRIVDTKSGAAMTTEAWSSGDIKLSDDCHGSLAVVWGKRENGLMNVTIAGNCPDKTPAGKKMGEFIVVLAARSSVEKGFDIQSQSDVNFWLAKLGTLNVDADCCNVVEAANNDDKVSKTADSQTKEVKKNSTIVLQAILTDRRREYLAQMQAFDDQRKLIAQKQVEQAKSKADAQEQERLQSEEKARTEAQSRLAQAEAEVALAKAKAEIAAKAVKETAKGEKEAQSSESKGGIAGDDAKMTKKIDSDDEKLKTKDGTGKDSKEKVSANNDKESEKKTGKEASSAVAAVPKETNRTTIDRDDWSARGAAKPSETTALASNNQSGVTAIATTSFTRNNQSSSMGWESPAVPVGPKQPSMTAVLLLPDRALAGQYLTAAVIDASHSPEIGVELSFNGASLTTDNKGQATFMVPEDATPGRSLNVSLSSRPDLSPGLIEIFQPLTVSANQDVPRIDKVSQTVSNKGTLTIDGHNFDGQAEHNRVIIDGINEGLVTASSPVQLRVGLPPNLTAGSHTVSVSTSGLRGNPGLFNVVAAEVQTDAKDNKIVVRVRGTTDKTQVHVTNQNPDVIKISRGNDIRVTTTGGDINQTTLGVQRLRKGSYRVTAETE